ncbi:MAG: M48 family metalloprotease, partial [Candidatus Omnitrophica bacterium]|nr:M48 family metalloprotease [Candidatus Omnitrophota bacterium]
MNTMRTGVLLTVLTVILIWMGQAIGGGAGASFAFLLAIGMNVGSWWFSDRIVLAMYRAQPIERHQAPELFGIVEECAMRAQIPTPKVYVLPQAAPNAFATGRDPAHGAVAVTQGLMALMDHDELKGVIAHELGHIRNRDTLVMCVAATIAGAITLLATMIRWAAIFGFGGRNSEDGPGNLLALLAMAIVAPLGATVVQLAISRSREFGADAQGA